MVTKLGNKPAPDVYRKDTFIELGLNCLSYIPQLFKVNYSNNLICKANNICYSWKNFDLEI